MTTHEWSLLIVIYLFCGGLGAGCLALAGVAHLLPGNGRQGIARAGAILAPLLVAFGSGLLVFDLGRPFKAWRLFVTIVPVSPMSIGSWLLLLFVPIGVATALLHAPPTWYERLSTLLPRLRVPLLGLARWNRAYENGLDRPAQSLGAAAAEASAPIAIPKWVPRLRTWLAVIGIPLGLSVGIYTGVLLGAIPARPFWNTPIVAQLFLFSALSTASALLLLAVPWFGRPLSYSERRGLLGADLVFIFLELFIIIPFIIHGELSVLSARAALSMVLGGPYTVAFWGGVVLLGVLLPGTLEALELAGTTLRWNRSLQSALHYGIPVLILMGGFVLRWIFVHAGQDTHFLD